MNADAHLFQGYTIRSAQLHKDDQLIVMVEGDAPPGWQPGGDLNIETYAVCYDGRADQWTWLPVDLRAFTFPASSGPGPEPDTHETVFLCDGGVAYMLNSVAYSFGFEGGAHGSIANVIPKETVRRINAAAHIGRSLYLVGAEQGVARRQSETQFQQIHFKPGGRSVRKHEDWHAIAGFSETDIYTTGKDRGDGSLFHFDGTDWTPMLLPSVIERFNGRAIQCLPDGNVYAVSQDAKVVKGNAVTGFNLVADPDPMTAPQVAGAHAVAWFKEKLYLSTLDWLFVLDGSTWQPVKSLSGFQPVSFKGLSANEDVMLQYGEAGLTLFDGKTWTKVYSAVTLEDLVRQEKLEEQLDLLGEGVDLIRTLRRQTP